MTLSELIDRAANSNDLEKAIALTFDDGFSDCYDVIAPILSEQKVKATFYLINDCIDNREMMWRNKLLYVTKRLRDKNKIESLIAELKSLLGNAHRPAEDDLLKWSLSWDMGSKDLLSAYAWEIAGLEPIEEFLRFHKPYMTGGNIKELLNDGFEIGSHTFSHPFCNKLMPTSLIYEIAESMKDLANRFNTEVSTFAYPFGLRAGWPDERFMLDKFNIKAMLGIKPHVINDKKRPDWWERHSNEHSFIGCVANYLLSEMNLGTRALFRNWNAKP